MLEYVKSPTSGTFELALKVVVLACVVEIVALSVAVVVPWLLLTTGFPVKVVSAD